MLTSPQLDRIQIVLVSPRNPLNIGAAARAMANFGFRRLAVVSPFEAHWREAKSAVGAPELLKKARETATLPEAVADCTLVVGTGTLTHRKPEQAVVSLSDLRPIVESELARGGRIALVFGSEKRGLSREDLAHCQLLVTVPTDPKQPSMNLGQAVAVCLYELAAHAEGRPASRQVCESAVKPTDTDTPVTSADLQRLAAVVEETMRAANYSPSIMRSANQHDVNLLLRRIALCHHDARRILGLFRRILWRLRNDGNRSNQ